METNPPDSEPAAAPESGAAPAAKPRTYLRRRPAPPEKKRILRSRAPSASTGAAGRVSGATGEVESLAGNPSENGAARARAPSRLASLVHREPTLEELLADPPLLSTALGKVLAAAILVAIIAAIAIAIYAVNASRIDPAVVKAELKAEVERINLLPGRKIIEKDEQVHSLLDDDAYQKYGGEIYAAVRRSHDGLHRQADLEKRARGKVRPFLSRLESLRADPERLAKEGRRAYDEARALLTQFGGTAYGEPLAVAIRELAVAIQGKGDR